MNMILHVVHLNENGEFYLFFMLVPFDSALFSLLVIGVNNV